MRRGCLRYLLAVVHLGHAAYAAASEAGVLIAIAPAINGALDQPSLAAQRRVELSKGPAHAIAIRLVHQPVSTVLILRAASPRIHAVLLLELGRKFVSRHRLNIASNRVFHLDPISGILKGNPLDTIAILSDNQRRGCGDRARRSVGINARSRVAGTL